MRPLLWRRFPCPRGAASEPTGASGDHIAVALESLDARVPLTVPDTPLVMAQQNTAFVPNLLVVPVGGQVTFPNHDAFFHNVFSYSPPRSFDLGRYPKGQTRTIRFQDPGIVRIFCEIHASMYGTIVVVNSNVYQIIKPGDPFTFGDLPAGHYRLLAVDATGRRSIQELALADGESQHVALTLE
ncbi:MAG: hypothetical protein HY304_02645 [candidate division Zixibacteria bacterium]|nr:hypothetical protein [candidate division Zixibacteria bacterium]